MVCKQRFLMTPFQISIKPSMQLFIFICLAILVNPHRVFSLPPAEDIPEEVLRTEIILEGRSPIDGQPLSAKEYAELQIHLAQSASSPKVNADIQELIFLLQLRKFIKTIIPFY